MAKKLIDHYPQLNHEELIRFRMKLEKEKSPSYPDDLLQSHMEYRLKDREKVGKFLGLVNKASGDLCTSGKGERAIGLDVGCGTGAGILALSSLCRNVIGADILMSDLILARKLLESEKINNFALVCCCAEQLPFKTGAFSLVHSRDVIEHVSDQKRYLSEAVRVLRRGRPFVFNSPNRFMFGLEPHVKLKRVGFLPRCAQPLYVKIMRGETYYEKLLSYFELTAMLRGLSLRFQLMNPGVRINVTERSTSLIGQIVRDIPFFAALINRYYYILQHEHEMIVYKD
jgi:SAM-dependent methyltransferase